MRFWKSRAQKRQEGEEELVLARLQEAAIAAAEHGYYSEYLQAVVRVAVRNIVPDNPDDEVARTMRRFYRR